MARFAWIAVFAMAAVSLHADLIPIDASARGWSGSDGGGDFNTIGSYLAGYTGFDLARDHFTFAIPTFSGTLTGATLTLDQPSGGYSGPDTHTFNIFSLGADQSYVAIGTGTLYGTVSLDSASAGTTIDIVLNSNALASITAAQGGTFNLGGVDSGEALTPGQHDFLGTAPGSGAFSSQLLLTTSSSSSPEPETVFLVLPALAGFALLRSRIRRDRVTSFPDSK